MQTKYRNNTTSELLSLIDTDHLSLGQQSELLHEIAERLRVSEEPKQDNQNPNQLNLF